MSYGYGAPQIPPAKKGMGTGMIILIVVLVLAVPMIGIFATLAIYGVRKYIANAKTAEARNTLGQIARDAVTAYEQDPNHRVCPSASAPVPANKSSVSGMKYQSMSSEWSADKAANAGFACLAFEMSQPQYFQYEYEATPTGFVARAHGDLNGDGVFSTFAVRGVVRGGRLVVAPSIEETSPEE